MRFFHRFEIVGEIQNIEVIATGRGIRSLARLRRTYGRGRWRKLKGTARIQVDDGRIFEAELHWYRSAWNWQETDKSEALARPETTMNAKTKRYVICIKNDDYEVDLSLGKVYRVIPERVSEARGFVRIVDESGEDYLYPRSYFLPIAVSKTIQRALAKAS